jgi:hypothetical protein
LAVLLGLCLLATAALAAPPETKAKPGDAKMAGLPPDKALALGERMYREGILPSGGPLPSITSGGVPVTGTAFSCVSCHVRSGLGSFEGGIITLPTNGAKLAQPRYLKYPTLLPEERKMLRVQTQPTRPPYTDETLAKVLRTGIDPGGRELNAAMPRYQLNDQDMAILIQYLWSLSAKLSPGAEGDTIHLATVITEEVSDEDQQAMLVPMRNYVARHNNLASGMGNRMYGSIGGKEMAGSFRKLSLSVWRLKGAPGTWGKQLEAHLAAEPVFALVGGISYGEWRPIHEFCEAQKLPCLFPITDLPIISDGDWYTQYFSKGYYQEGQAAARFLFGGDEQAASARIVQVIQEGPEGRQLAIGFQETLRELGQGPAKDIRLKPGEVMSSALLQSILQNEQPTVLLVWTGAGAFQALEGLADLPGRPGKVFMSSRLLGTQAFAIPEKARDQVWLTYPYRDPLEEPKFSRYANSLLAGLGKHKPETRISTRTYSMLQVFQALQVEMDRNLYRDNFFDRLGMMRDYVLPDFLRLSFGPGQRYASKGCFIMQLSPGPDPKWVRRSEWVIH